MSHQYHWKVEEIQAYAVVSICYFGIGYFLLRKFVSDNAKAKSWILSILVSTVMWMLSIKVIIDMINYGKWSLEFLEDNSAIGVFQCVMFIVFLFFDLIVGCMDYYDQIQLLTGWIHHIVYLGICAHCLNANFANAFGILTLIELPTTILGIGSAIPSLRSDAGFGISFILTRVLYHSYVTYHFFILGGKCNLWMVSFPPLLLHYYWGTLWVQGQMRRGKKHKEGAEEKND